MKKYIKPITKVVEIETNSLLAGSDPSLNDKQGNGSWHAKGNFWEDDED